MSTLRCILYIQVEVYKIINYCILHSNVTYNNYIVTYNKLIELFKKIYNPRYFSKSFVLSRNVLV